MEQAQVKIEKEPDLIQVAVAAGTDLEAGCKSNVPASLKMCVQVDHGCLGNQQCNIAELMRYREEGCYDDTEDDDNDYIA